MNLSNKITFGFALMAGVGFVSATPAIAQQSEADSEGLASTALVGGNTTVAIDMLKKELRQYPNDPALMINLGIALAQSGKEAEARVQFNSALASNEVIELDTANGRTTDSRKLARKAIAMLERGDFRPVPLQSDRLTLRN